MTSEEFEEIMSGKYRYPIPPEDYLSTIKDENEKYIITIAYAKCQYAIDFLSNFYNYKGRRPTLYADPYKLISARASGEKIIISRGVIDHAKKCLPSELVYINSVGARKISFMQDELFSDLAIFWIVAHEFFHYINGHLQLKNKYKEFEVALEYDADNSATAATYRYFEVIHKKNFSTDEIKSIVLYPIFWCIRTIIGEEIGEAGNSETHPSWPLRLKYTVDKLSCMNIPHPNYGITQEYAQSIEKLIDQAILYEEDYLAKNKINDENNLIEKIFEENYVKSNTEHIELLKAWEVVYPEISRITIRNKSSPLFYYHFPTSYKNMDYLNPYGKKYPLHYIEIYTLDNENSIILRRY